MWPALRSGRRRRTSRRRLRVQASWAATGSCSTSRAITSIGWLPGLRDGCPVDQVRPGVRGQVLPFAPFRSFPPETPKQPPGCCFTWGRREAYPGRGGQEAARGVAQGDRRHPLAQAAVDDRAVELDYRASASPGRCGADSDGVPAAGV